ncbi:hypothetical protein BDM02DRAFT_1054406 [Thelephora ganbajun]|uniref:Uncharacterized protein n=1 Tax=Thelephora ganbajun TaxID=370292 RepID=A0ACB6Z3T5_THEGA|nr:hypothetical protein BDM02DRAFT_1054406 [Thelephora ganbajun]
MFGHRCGTKYTCCCAPRRVAIPTSTSIFNGNTPRATLYQSRRTPLPGSTIDSTAAEADMNKDAEELTETNEETVAWKFPSRILNDIRWNIFYYPESSASGSSGIDVERIQGLPGKTGTISNVSIGELDNSVEQTQAITLSPVITIHLSVSGTNIREDKQRLKERPHTVTGTIGRIFTMLEHTVINSGDIKFLCVDGIQHLLGSGYTNEFAESCEQLPKDIEVVFPSTEMRYRTSHDLSKLLTHEPLHFLVKEEPTPEPITVDPSRSEDMTRSAVRPDADNTCQYSTWFRCEVGECWGKFPTKDYLGSRVRIFYWQTTSRPGEHAVVASDKDGGGTGKLLTSKLSEDNAPYNDKDRRVDISVDYVKVTRLSRAHGHSDG